MSNLVGIKNNKVVVSSKQIAEKFGKEHKDVLESLRQVLVAENSATKFFEKSSYKYRGRDFPIYYMNRDGFTLLVMGFTGDKAIKWKIKYINAFNEMEAKLQNNMLTLAPKNELLLNPHNAEFKSLIQKMQRYLTTLHTLFEIWPTAYRTQKDNDGYYCIVMDHIYSMSREMIGFKNIKFQTGTIEELKFGKK